MAGQPDNEQGLREAAARLAKMIRQADKVVALTGAGVSTESGLPDFRSRQGLWSQRDPREVASIQAFHHEPLTFLRFYSWRIRQLSGAMPNRAHRALAGLEKHGYLHMLITQNVDRLHQAAGSRRVVEMHGNLRELECASCKRMYDSTLLDKEINSLADAPRCECGGLLRPRVVLFGEMLPASALDTAMKESSNCDLMIVAGTALQVGPVNMLPELALDAGAKVAIINRDPTPLDGMAHLVWNGNAGDILSETCRELGLEV